MARNWILILGSRGEDWKVPAADIQDLAAKAGAAAAALEAARDEITRTPVVNAQCRAAFAALEERMRDIKRRHFFVPPLTEADVIALGLKPADPVRTPSEAPTAQVRAEVFLIGPRELGVQILYVTGDPKDAANKEYRIWYVVVPPGGEAPQGPEGFTTSFSTFRRKDVIRFEYGDSGKTVYIMVQVENGGKKGPFGPMTSAVIP
jgi:hypothetical protein